MVILGILITWLALAALVSLPLASWLGLRDRRSELQRWADACRCLDREDQ